MGGRLLGDVVAGASDGSPISARDCGMYEKGIECEEVRLRKEESCSCKGRAEDRARLSTGTSRRRARGRSSCFELMEERSTFFREHLAQTRAT
ncbi:hypothetical protein ACHAXT_002634 [Thalassiosira profunda]